MGEKNGLDLFFKEIFQDLCINGVTPSIIPRVEYLFNEVSKSNDVSIYTNKNIIGTVFLLEHYSYNSLLLNIGIKRFKQNYIEYVINNSDNNIEENQNKCEDKCAPNDLELIQLEALERELFEYTEDGKILKDKSQIPPKGQYVKIRRMSDPQHGIEFSVDDKGFLVYSCVIDDTDLSSIDYDEAYSDDLEDVLKYKDEEEEEEKMDESDL